MEETPFYISTTCVEFQGYADSKTRSSGIIIGVKDGQNSCPVVISGPLTSRFRADGPEELPSPMMPLLKPETRITYRISFIPPEQDESDFIWDNFQDYLVFHSPMGRVEIPLRAMKSSDQVHPDNYYPKRLPTVKAPSSKIFEFIKKYKSEAPIKRSSPIDKNPSLPSIATPADISRKIASINSDAAHPIEKHSEIIPKSNNSDNSFNRKSPLPTYSRVENVNSVQGIEQMPECRNPSPNKPSQEDLASHVSKMDAKSIIHSLRAKHSAENSVDKTVSSVKDPQQELKQFEEIVQQVKSGGTSHEDSEREFYQTLILQKEKEKIQISKGPRAQRRSSQNTSKNANQTKKSNSNTVLPRNSSGANASTPPPTRPSQTHRKYKEVKTSPTNSKNQEENSSDEEEIDAIEPNTVEHSRDELRFYESIIHGRKPDPEADNATITVSDPEIIPHQNLNEGSENTNKASESFIPIAYTTNGDSSSEDESEGNNIDDKFTSKAKSSAMYQDRDNGLSLSDSEDGL